MKINETLAFCLSFTLMSFIETHAQVGIGTVNPVASAQLEVSSETKGFLPPRMTAAQRNAIINPVAGLVIYCTDCRELQVYNGSGWRNMAGGASFSCGNNVSFIYRGVTVTYGTVSSNGKCWLDRNLGALRVATSSTDASAYGDLFQWGRGDDGHQLRTSSTTATLAGTDYPGHGSFITVSTIPYDWRDPQNGNLWQGVEGGNNPCPTGWRAPTEAEWNSEMASWSSNNAAGAFASPLKLSLVGYRDNTGSLSFVNTYGFYWASTLSTTSARSLGLSSSDAQIFSYSRVRGFAVRCIKD